MLGSRATVLVVLAALVAGEWALGAFGGYGRSPVADRDPRYGVVLLPDQDALADDGRTAIRINGEGFRDVEWGPARPRPEVLQVAVIGDSVSFGLGIERDSAWPALLEQRLREALGDDRPVQVLNFSRPGYGCAQKLFVHADHVRPRRPDVVVYALGLQDIQRIPLVETPRRGPIGRWLLRTAWYDLAVRGAVRGGVKRIAGDGREPEWARYNSRVIESPFDSAHRAGWLTVLARLEELRFELAERGARLLVVPNPTLAEAWRAESVTLEGLRPALSPGLASCWVSTRPAFRAKLEQALDRLRALGVEAGELRDGRAPQLRGLTVELLQEDGVELPWLTHDLHHLSEVGHAILAELVAEAFLTRG